MPDVGRERSEPLASAATDRREALGVVVVVFVVFLLLVVILLSVATSTTCDQNTLETLAFCYLSSHCLTLFEGNEGRIALRFGVLSHFRRSLRPVRMREHGLNRTPRLRFRPRLSRLRFLVSPSRILPPLCRLPQV